MNNNEDNWWRNSKRLLSSAALTFICTPSFYLCFIFLIQYKYIIACTRALICPCDDALRFTALPAIVAIMRLFSKRQHRLMFAVAGEDMRIGSRKFCPATLSINSQQKLLKHYVIYIHKVTCDRRQFCTVYCYRLLSIQWAHFLLVTSSAVVCALGCYLHILRFLLRSWSTDEARILAHGIRLQSEAIINWEL